VSEFKLNLLNRLHLIWEIITTRSGHKHSSSSKQLSTFQQGYSAGVEDERYNTKDLERKLAEANDKNTWIKKQQESWNSTTQGTIKDLERKLEEAIEIAENAINEINPDPLEGRKFTVMELYKRLEQLKEKG
jgi:hypothetical protein